MKWEILGECFAAISDFDQTLSLKPSYAEAYGARGETKNLLGHPKEAISDFDQAIHLDPDNPKHYYIRGITKNSLDTIGDGKIDLQMALNLAEKIGDEKLKERIMKEL